MALMKPVILVPVFLFARALAADGDAGGSRQSLKAAVGDVSQLPPIERAAFSDDATAFKPLAKPGPNDWLAHHREEGQTLCGFDLLQREHALAPIFRENRFDDEAAWEAARIAPLTAAAAAGK